METCGLEKGLSEEANTIRELHFKFQHFNKTYDAKAKAFKEQNSMLHEQDRLKGDQYNKKLAEFRDERNKGKQAAIKRLKGQPA